MIILLVFMLMFFLGFAGAKTENAQDKIILLNDAAAALEDTRPQLSRVLFQMADEKEKEWEAANGKHAVALDPVQDPAVLKERAAVLRKAALLVHATYPLIADGLDKMAKDMDAAVEKK